MKHFIFTITVALVVITSATLVGQQGRIDSGTREGVIGVKIAVPEFQAGASDPKTTALTAVFNKVLWDDLEYSGGVTLVSRSLYPLGKFSNPGDIKTGDWTKQPIDAQFIAFGTIRLASGNMVTAEARLWDLKTTQNPEVGSASKLYRS